MTYTIFQPDYLGGALEFDIDLSRTDCGSAAGVYLVDLNDENCHMEPYATGETPQCAVIDILEANVNNIHVQSLPCDFGTCDLVSQCKAYAHLMWE